MCFCVKNCVTSPTSPRSPQKLKVSLRCVLGESCENCGLVGLLGLVALQKRTKTMAIYRKERPQCRKVIERILEEGYATLKDIARGWCLDAGHLFSDGLRTQARKMLEESEAKNEKRTS